MIEDQEEKKTVICVSISFASFYLISVLSGNVDVSISFCNLLVEYQNCVELRITPSNEKWATKVFFLYMESHCCGVVPQLTELSLGNLASCFAEEKWLNVCWLCFLSTRKFWKLKQMTLQSLVMCCENPSKNTNQLKQTKHKTHKPLETLESLFLTAASVLSQLLAFHAKSLSTLQRAVILQNHSCPKIVLDKGLGKLEP